jgi:hypothetical protein
MYTIKYAQHPFSQCPNEFMEAEDPADYLVIGSYDVMFNNEIRSKVSGRYGCTILEVCTLQDGNKTIFYKYNGYVAPFISATLRGILPEEKRPVYAD